MSSSGFLVTRPLSLAYPEILSTGRQKRTPSLPLSAEQINMKYCGLDGDAWPYEELFINEGVIIHEETGLASLDQYAVLIQAYKSLPPGSACRLILLTDNPFFDGCRNTEFEGAFDFLGVDYGNYVCKYNHFSVILHEVLYGKYDVMRQYATVLNECLLFSDLDITKRLENDRWSLIETNADLETVDADESFGPIMIWGKGSQLK
jgi:hypothetical protein